MLNPRLIAFAIACVATSLGAGCATTMMRHVPPQRLVGEAGLAGMPNIRIWADASPAAVSEFLQADGLGPRSNSGSGSQLHPRDFNILAISGGGEYGAFGAGFIVGWGESGARPDFDVVTGVSVGALIAPFVFLGRNRDHQVREAFGSSSPPDLVSPSLSNLLFNSAILDSAPLENVIAKYVDSEFLAEVAREHAKGKLLLIATTNLDAQRSVLWNMGRIAKSGHPYALTLFRRILLASAAVPGVFPPVRIKVETSEGYFEELHVDGGVAQQVFVPPPATSPQSGAVGTKRSKRRIFVIRNDKVAPEWEAADSGILSISARTIATLIKNQGIGDLYRIYAVARRDNLEFNLAAIPAELDLKNKQPFDSAPMRGLYDVGYSAGYLGYPWMRQPPGMSANSGTNRTTQVPVR